MTRDEMEEKIKLYESNNNLTSDDDYYIKYLSTDGGICSIWYDRCNLVKYDKQTAINYAKKLLITETQITEGYGRIYSVSVCLCESNKEIFNINIKRYSD